MWVFGYGSLMWDSWETNYGCSRRVVADLYGYCRRFNKASVRNWGTKTTPGPTLNLAQFDTGFCRGIAFQFPDVQKMAVLSYLEEREGNSFPLKDLTVRLEDNSEVSALVPLYNGKNIIEGQTTEQLAAMVLAASGTDGSCVSYVKGIADKLSTLGINDPAVSELWKAVNNDA
ncbi:gamma-glutamylcyclotransferase [Methylophilus sp.]|uniref:gamma-glutamylcyclotransferase n=1 Tax=Methylophilus sp. TaxID=29541 RepID=UPI000D3FAA64|nr:gamma-glutamylcyclotransferase [Methylophilus sp.]PPD10697.1 MAG: cation transporter [Methylophilus sp.]